MGVRIITARGAKKLGLDESRMTCGTCDREGPARQHPCRFEVACSCWRGIPCDGSGRVKRQPRAER